MKFRLQICTVTFKRVFCVESIKKLFSESSTNVVLLRWFAKSFQKWKKLRKFSEGGSLIQSDIFWLKIKKSDFWHLHWVIILVKLRIKSRIEIPLFDSSPDFLQRFWGEPLPLDNVRKTSGGPTEMNISSTRSKMRSQTQNLTDITQIQEGSNRQLAKKNKCNWMSLEGYLIPVQKLMKLRIKTT